MVINGQLDAADVAHWLCAVASGGSAAPVITLPSSGDDYPGHALYFDGYSGARIVVNLDLQQTAPITQFTVSAW